MTWLEDEIRELERRVDLADSQPFTSPKLSCFVCGDSLPVQPSKESTDFIQEIARRGFAFIVCVRCFDVMLTEDVRKKRIVMDED